MRLMRRAQVSDADAIQTLYQRVAADPFEDRLLLRREELVQNLGSSNWFWIVETDSSDRLKGFVYAHLDSLQGLCKLQRLYTEDSKDLESARRLLEFMCQEVENDPRHFSMIYTTTRTFSKDLQAMTFALGFRLLAVFPTAQGVDPTGINGLTALYFSKNQSLEKRDVSFRLHPILEKHFALAAKALNLKAQPVADLSHQRPDFRTAIPSLELIEAPHFVARKYQILRERRFLSHTFYPFSEPNAMLVDPDQKIEVFVRLISTLGFATVITEKLEVPYDPVKLYTRVAQILHQAGYRYVEVLNDAGDVEGIEAIRRAGFFPTGYIPGFKKQGEYRRDFGIFANSLEKTPQTQIQDERYRDWLKAYKEAEEWALNPTAGV